MGRRGKEKERISGKSGISTGPGAESFNFLNLKTGILLSLSTCFQFIRLANYNKKIRILENNGKQNIQLTFENHKMEEEDYSFVENFVKLENRRFGVQDSNKFHKTYSRVLFMSLPLTLQSYCITLHRHYVKIHKSAEPRGGRGNLTICVLIVNC